MNVLQQNRITLEGPNIQEFSIDSKNDLIFRGSVYPPMVVNITGALHYQGESPRGINSIGNTTALSDSSGKFVLNFGEGFPILDPHLATQWVDYPPYPDLLLSISCSLGADVELSVLTVCLDVDSEPWSEGQYSAFSSFDSGYLGVSEGVFMGSLPTGVSPIPLRVALRREPKTLKTLAGTHLTFYAEATGGFPPYSYSLDFGDGSKIEGKLGYPCQIGHRYQDGGMYAVSLLVTDSKGTRVGASSSLEVQHQSGKGHATQPNKHTWARQNRMGYIVLRSSYAESDMMLTSTPSDPPSVGPGSAGNWMNDLDEIIETGVLATGSFEVLKALLPLVRKRKDDTRMATVSKLCKLIEDLEEPELEIIDKYLDIRLAEKANRGSQS